MKKMRVYQRTRLRVQGKSMVWRKSVFFFFLVKRGDVDERRLGVGGTNDRTRRAVVVRVTKIHFDYWRRKRRRIHPFGSEMIILFRRIIISFYVGDGAYRSTRQKRISV